MSQRITGAQVAAWDLELVYSYASFAKTLRALSGLVQNARTDVA